MDTTISSIGSALAYSGQLSYEKQAIPQVQEPPEQTDASSDTVNISSEARSLLQNYQQKESRLEERYNNDAEQLEREYLEEKNRLRSEYQQKKQSLGISLFA